MAGTITALTVQKRNKRRVNVHLDGRFAFGLAAIEAAHLRVGQTLSDAEIARLREQDQVERAYERALNFLSYRPRSEVEVRRNLREKGVEAEVIEEVVARLTRAGLLDDRAFAGFWVENREQFNPRGERALRHELRQKGVAADIVEAALEGYDEESAAERAAEEGARRLGHQDDETFRRRLSGYLARRGFSYQVSRPAVERALRVRTPLGSQSETESEG